MFVFFMFFEDFPGSGRDVRGDSGKPCHFYAIAPICGARFNRSQEDDPAFCLLDGDVVIPYSRQKIGQLG